METITSLAIISAVFVGLAAGYLGSFMILRRMALVGDALSHVALPGIALGILLGFNPLFGAFAALFLGIISIWLIEKKSRLSTESLVGLFFTVSLSIGLLLIPDEEVIEALFGDISQVTTLDAGLSVVLALLVIYITSRITKNLVLGTLSEDLAKASGIKTEKTSFIFLFLVALIVALGIKVVGTLLMGALVIIPAITAKNFAKSLRTYIWSSAAIGALSGLLGIIIADSLSLSPGPVVVIVSGALFLISLPFSKK